MNKEPSLNTALLYICAILGACSFAMGLAYHNIADGDLWARLAQGAFIWKSGGLIHKDIFAFTPVLPQYIDHEWGSGLIFFSLLKFFGPASLLFLKIILGLSTVLFALMAGRVRGIKWETLLLIAIPISFAIAPAYAPVVRSYVFTYLFFSITLFCLETMRIGRRWAAISIVILMILWPNFHGGFLAGLSVIFIYVFAALISRKMSIIMLTTGVFSLAATLINPYGIRLWKYLITAVLHPSAIPEWGRMPLFVSDSLFGFRLLFVLAVVTIIIGWKFVKGKSLTGLIILALTAYLSFRHRRHAPLFILATAAFIGPYAEEAIKRTAIHVRLFFRSKIVPMAVIAAVYMLITLSMVLFILPKISFMVLAPVGFYPVREADILMQAKASGNLVVPLRWGDYAMWRLYPKIKISFDGRNETMYPESTFRMNEDFFLKSGENWDRMFKIYKIDYIMFELASTRLQPSDINKLGFEVIWCDGYSALCARKDLVPLVNSIARDLPPETVQPLDAHIPDKW